MFHGQQSACRGLFRNYAHRAEHTKDYLFSCGTAQSALCLSYRKGYTGFDSLQVKRYYNPQISQLCLEPTQLPIHWERGIFAWGKSDRGGDVITQLHLKPRLKMGGVQPHSHTWLHCKVRDKFNFVFICPETAHTVRVNCSTSCYCCRRQSGYAVDSHRNLIT